MELHKLQSSTPRQRARLEQARIRLGRGKVGHLTGFGLCLYTEGVNLKVGSLTLVDLRQPLIGLDAHEPDRLNVISRRFDRHVTEVAADINQLWTSFAKTGRGHHACRQMAALN